jgi:acyl carrier protein
MDLIEIVRNTASKEELLDNAGMLMLNSMSVIDFVLALEDASGIEVPNSEMTEENFKSIESVAQLLQRLRES